ncbi:MAG: squalene synthase HpnC [Acidobacteria bacterium]|nr:squalene synthase HpnC [Acidobacteriota bacterium]
MAARHYENFPVASRLLPRVMRPHVAAVYAFARTADDFADEGVCAPDERRRLIDDWESRVRASRAGDDRAARPALPGQPPETVDIFLALGETIRRLDLPVSLFEDLLSAFRQDIMTTRYERWSDVLDYCRRSANPVGRLVLRIAGARDPSLDERSDDLCTALQLANFWQDFGRDWQHGRLYVPLEDLRACGARAEDLARGVVTHEWRCAFRRVVDRTRALFDRGRGACDGVRGRLRIELRLTWLGGCRILERFERQGYDPLRDRPVLGLLDAPVLAWRLLRWRAAGPARAGHHD